MNAGKRDEPASGPAPGSSGKGAITTKMTKLGTDKDANRWVHSRTKGPKDNWMTARPSVNQQDLPPAAAAALVD